jgi:small subunit ribosomal protein S17
MEQKSKHKRQFKGVIVSNGMNKTIVVRIDSVKTHPKYGKQYARSKKYHVHDEKGTHAVGETVSFVECRPLSKTKRWRVIG